MSDVINIKDFYDQEKRITIVENAICQINTNMHDMKIDMHDFRADMKSQHRWIMGLITGLYASIFTTLITIIAVIVKLH